MTEDESAWLVKLTDEKTMELKAFIGALHNCVESGHIRRFCVDSRRFYESLLAAKFTEDEAIRILSHSFTRMISEGG